MSESDSESKATNGEEGASGEEPDRVHRRGFFREGFRHLLKPIAEILEERLERVGIPTDEDYPSDAGGPPSGPSYYSPAVPDRPVLRPPGALEEEEFLDRCLSSGQCVSVCPVNAIQLVRSDDARRDDKPFIDPETQACVVCDDLACMNVCPSGALVPSSVEEVHMGLAELREELCLRTQGEDCQICVDKCPLGSRAIEIPYEGGAVEVRDSGCTGCGVCQMYCPTEPRAIVVLPASIGDEEDPLEGDPMDPESYHSMGYLSEDDQD